MPNRSVVYIVFAVFGLVLAGCAGGSQSQSASPVTQADLNSDARVTCEEWTEWLDVNYPRFDSDGSQAWNEAEYNQFIATTGLFTSVPLADVDANGDQSYELTELATYSQGAFSRIDKNGDCALSGAELLVRAPAPQRTTRRSTSRPSRGSGVPRGSFVD